MENIISESKIREDLARIQNAVKIATGVRPGMNILLDYCFKTCESLAWKEITKLNFEKDSLYLQHWLEKTFKKHPPSENIQAFWFGCNNPTEVVRKSPVDLYVSGSSNFNADDRKAGWAQRSNATYKPQGCEVRSAVLPRIHDLLVKYEVVDVGGLVLCLGYASLVIKFVFLATDNAWSYGLYGPRPIMVGDNEGHFIYIGMSD